MGTWGIGTFDSDYGLDWLDELKQTADLSCLSSSLEASGPDEEEDLEADDGVQFIAAAEVVLALMAGPRSDLPPEAMAWVQAHQSLDATPLVARSIRCLDLVLQDASELRELWEENEEDYPKWQEDVQDLRAKLRALES